MRTTDSNDSRTDERAVRTGWTVPIAIVMILLPDIRNNISLFCDGDFNHFLWLGIHFCWN